MNAYGYLEYASMRTNQFFPMKSMVQMNLTCSGVHKAQKKQGPQFIQTMLLVPPTPLTTDRIRACIRAAEATIPHTKRRGRAGWKRHAEPQKKIAILWNRIWKESGSPNTGIIHSIRKKTRAEYRRASRWVVRNEEKQKADKMTDTLHSRDFWTEIQRMQRKHTSTTTEMDGERGEDAIRELFVGKYEELYNSVPYDREEKGDILTTLNSRVNEQCKQGKCYDDHKVSVGDVHKAIRSLKHSKSDANNLLSSDHFKNACRDSPLFGGSASEGS
ncbi:hypothetical protein CAPTEDRAFT_215825 [Capitella teleta]|uniref:Uncharacterized protein n=1 Tax=Capitella teleta TaxID=283909 RepID=R7UKU7_CAPTE|nr:hypothetical protein CAPTEDRAFT_215825 [Capitella teleta]|eukprot:ELU06860.1 hypothetical protein CAPTEDRAFT_215825 [Capitella teleta]